MSYGGQMQYGPGMGSPRPPQPGMNGPPPTQTSIQFMLDENTQLIQSIIDNHQQGNFIKAQIVYEIEFFQGKLNDAVPFQQRLHKNLVYLATVADSQGSGSILGGAPPPGKLSS